MEPSSLSPEKRLKVELGPRSYEIEVVTGGTPQFGAFVREALDRTWTGSSCRSALIVTDGHLAELLDSGAVTRPLLDAVASRPRRPSFPRVSHPSRSTQAERLYDELVTHEAPIATP